MVFSSLVFICVFLPVVFLLNLLIPPVRGKNALLIVASLVFYAYGEPVYIVLMIVSTLVNWALGLAIGSGMYILGIFTTIIVDVIQIIMHKHTIGVDSMRIGRLRCTTSSPDAFRQQLDEYIDSKGMQILDVKIEFSEDGTTAYELTLRMGRDMTISDMSGFLESMDNVKAISFEMENS